MQDNIAISPIVVKPSIDVDVAIYPSISLEFIAVAVAIEPSILVEPSIAVAIAVFV